AALAVVPPGAGRISCVGPGDAPTLTGTARVPWARVAGHLVVLCDRDDGGAVVALVARDALEVRPGRNLAGEPLDTVVFDGAVAVAVGVPPAGVNAEALLLRGALSRSLLMAGAMEHIVVATTAFAAQRTQFGQPIRRFQAVGRHLALLAEESALAGHAAQTATEALVAAEAGHAGVAGAVGETGGVHVRDRASLGGGGGVAVGGPPSREAIMTVAAAKLIAGRAAGEVAARAHQIHGAIGLTMEFPLQYFTRRLWSWRDEYGSERYWSTVLGRHVVAQGQSMLWPLLTAAPVSRQAHDGT
ncbi:acyl-CoA dehydrogenase family protein, partial [Frankia sp. Cr1]|uniref:acyl-CoA dehydrogenase family protein n=1 Tax=Frankia sp. Cr1 TaxID=3073931 RepID=UPI002AD3DF3A